MGKPWSDPRGLLKMLRWLRRKGERDLQEQIMKIPVCRYLKLAAMALTFVIAVTTTSAAQSDNSSAGNGLAGTWRVTVQLQNCATQASIGGPFQSLLIFNAGGTMVGTTSNPGFAAGQRSDDLGAWSYTGGQTYLAASEAYILFPTAAFVAGTQRIAQAISVDGDQFTAAATVQFFDTNHVQYRAACAVAHGQRFQ
jgi:hypothetical protein